MKMHQLNIQRILTAVLLSGLFFLAGNVQAQQDPQYTQYMFNQLPYNPGYAGSAGTINANVLLRRQWMGISNGPATGSFAIHGPSPNQRHGFGFNVVHDRLGITRQNFISGSYAYRVPVGEFGFLSLGLTAGITHYTNRYEDILTQTNDASIPTENLTAVLPRVGPGIYFEQKRFYVGLSAPNVLAGRYYRFQSGVADNIAAEQEIHYFGIVGFLLPLTPDIDLRPSLVTKFVSNTPLQMDINATLFFKQTFGVGIGYRTQDALTFMLEYRSTRRFRLGYAYDLTLSDVSSVSSGSHELMIGFDFGLKKSGFITPRYF